ncbi:MAG: SLC13 family permease, partial [Promethearchaeota archaeon]
IFMLTIWKLSIALILIGTLLLIMLERIDKTLVAMTGAGLALLVAIIPGSGNEEDVLIPDVEHLFELLELDLFLVIIGITLMIGTARETGLFEYIAVVVLKKSGYNQFFLLTALSFLTLIFSAVLGAFMAVLIVASVTLVSCESLDINPKPYIISEAIYGNLGGSMTRVASPPNLIIGGHFDIDFITFLYLTGPYILCVSIITLFMLFYIFKDELKKPISQFFYKELLLIDKQAIITEPKSFNIAATILILTILGFAVSSFLPIRIELGYIAMTGGFAMVGFTNMEMNEALSTVKWSLVFFLIGLLILIGISEKIGILEYLIEPIETIFELDLFIGILSLLWLNAFTSAVLDNVAMASIMTSVMDQVVLDNPSMPFNPLLVSVVIGTNLGGNITPIGSASTIQAIEILEQSEKKEAKTSFLEFIKIGCLITIFQLFFGSIYIGVIWLVSL